MKVYLVYLKDVLIEAFSDPDVAELFVESALHNAKDYASIEEIEVDRVKCTADEDGEDCDCVCEDEDKDEEEEEDNGEDYDGDEKIEEFKEAFNDIADIIKLLLMEE